MQSLASMANKIGKKIGKKVKENPRKTALTSALSFTTASPRILTKTVTVFLQMAWSCVDIGALLTVQFARLTRWPRR
ncbi:hypothetical protein F6X40_17640 [Paraburkholderia sp. UCT31]|uniref:hypothetical protein n=1 Tax=Paraburkholderia sp. UCT31 TaxID=2615209 RepID=UPI00165528C6|nr:hypothetical protein [Paraburkholderia sp. UCT31]MBC8738584.1 hypothetical protein [Paraburkholderia sp. UCT31]